MKVILFIISLLLATVTGYCQNLVDYKADEIRKYMKTNRSEMNMEKVNNKSFRYLKYADKHDTQTMLFFLSPDSVCQNIRIVCNNNIRETKIKELDSSFSGNGKNRWIDKRSDKNYYIRLDDDEWTFTITIEPVK